MTTLIAVVFAGMSLKGIPYGTIYPARSSQPYLFSGRHSDDLHFVLGHRHRPSRHTSAQQLRLSVLTRRGAMSGPAGLLPSAALP